MVRTGAVVGAGGDAAVLAEVAGAADALAGEAEAVAAAVVGAVGVFAESAVEAFVALALRSGETFASG